MGNSKKITNFAAKSANQTADDKNRHRLRFLCRNPAYFSRKDVAIWIVVRYNTDHRNLLKNGVLIMAEKRVDRRIRRTKRLLRQALAELMNEKEFKDITVKEITERADLNRGTFYFHYTDTYDLKDKIENELIDVFRENLDSYQPTEDNHSVQDIAASVLGYIREN